VLKKVVSVLPHEAKDVLSLFCV